MQAEILENNSPEEDQVADASEMINVHLPKMDVLKASGEIEWQAGGVFQ